MVFRLPALQASPRFFITFPLQIMQQRRIRILRQLPREFVNPGKKRQQIRPGTGRGHRLRRLLQFNQRLQKALFGRGHVD